MITFKDYDPKEIECLKDSITNFLSRNNTAYKKPSAKTYADLIVILESIVLSNALERLNGNQVRAVKVLSIDRNTLRKRIKNHNINAKIFKKDVRDEE